MQMEELAEKDRADREYLHQKAIADTERGIRIRRAGGADTHTLEAQLAQLKSAGPKASHSAQKLQTAEAAAAVATAKAEDYSSRYAEEHERAEALARENAALHRDVEHLASRAESEFTLLAELATHLDRLKAARFTTVAALIEKAAGIHG